eukprot:TRINITY_DN4639_c0_g1_i1.p1 TRINITY_DN4639_c0_g1~~TRINITY_DN4639_c0_g1_i1.p1  ORF type:complete len:388 (-),score=74.01 TRINITY_DN4639_c0_g1_i1:21-1142(-)
MADVYKGDLRNSGEFDISSSFPNYLSTLSQEDTFNNDINRTRILLAGFRKAGKSSIQKVVFHKMSANETLYLEPTNKIIKSDISTSSFMQFQIWDFPGDFDWTQDQTTNESIFKNTGALIYVIDAQDEFGDTLLKLHTTVTKAFEINPKIVFEVFIHKVDGLSDEQKMDAQREIQQQANEDLMESKLDGIINLSYHLTSIYDHSIFEAFSKVVQKLIPQLATLENLLDILISNSRMEKAYLVDVASKIYIASDTTYVDMQQYELCSDMIDVIIDVSCIYGTKDDSKESFTHDPETQSVIRLNNGNVLYLKEVNKYLALICLLREDKFDKHGLIDYNFQIFKKAITEVFEVGKADKFKGQKLKTQQTQTQGGKK